MFYGEHAITVDDKGRMAMPADFRSLLAGYCQSQLVVTYSPYELECLWIFPKPDWERVRDEVMTLNAARHAHRLLQRKLVGSAAHVELDSSGRLSLPAAARGTTGLKKSAVLLGLGSKFELWTESAQQARAEQVISEANMSEEMLKLSF
jgi:MraZ protein